MGQLCYLVLLYICVASVLPRVSAQNAKIVFSNGVEVAAIASTSSSISLSATTTYELHFPASPQEQFGCSAVAALPATPALKALVLRRSGCSFEEKMLNGQAAGANLVIIMNSEHQVQNTSSGLLFNPCTVNCELGSSASSATECAAASTCRTNYCLPNAVDVSQVASQKFCCVENDPIINMAYSNSSITVGGLHVSTASGNILITAAATNEEVTVQEAGLAFTGFPGSAVALLFIGTIVTVLASYRATRVERLEICGYWGQGSKRAAAAETGASEEEGKPKPVGSPAGAPPEDPDGAFEQVEITLALGLCFLMVSTASLVGFYFLFKLYPTEGVIAIIGKRTKAASSTIAYFGCNLVLYAIGSVFSTSYFFIQPLLSLVLCGKVAAYRYPLGPNAAACLDTEALSVKSVLGTLIAISLAIVWFVFRHSDWAWVLQNIFSAALACIFLVTVRISSLKIATVILFGFFVYDIFMVFITPSFGNGESIMVEVATGEVELNSEGREE